MVCKNTRLIGLFRVMKIRKGCESGIVLAAVRNSPVRKTHPSINISELLYFTETNLSEMKKSILMGCTMLAASGTAFSQIYDPQEGLKHTYSIVARDEVTGELGVAVQSHWFAVGTVVAWAKPGVGAVATQAMANISLGPKSLDLLSQGIGPEEVIARLLAEDQGAAYRQLAVIDFSGNSAAHTGDRCIAYAGHRTGKNYSLQANMMLKDDVVESMEKAWLASKDLPFAERFLVTLEAAEAAGGDIRGRQSASLLIVKGTATPNVWEERLIDLRVDDHAEPLEELRRLYLVHSAYRYMNEAEVALENGATEQAMNTYNKALELMPDNPEMPFWTAISLAQKGEMEQAEALLQKVYAHDPNWRELVRRLVPTGMLQLSEQDLERLLR
jgi:uncharacterized Ntn-hydrolase superfamily protein